MTSTAVFSTIHFGNVTRTVAVVNVSSAHLHHDNDDGAIFVLLEIVDSVYTIWWSTV